VSSWILSIELCFDWDAYLQKELASPFRRFDGAVIAKDPVGAERAFVFGVAKHTSFL
jgi:hypothetical protein